MSPEAQLHEHALHAHQAEAFQQPVEALQQHTEAVVHLRDTSEQHPDHHIDLKEAHACAPDCPEHSGGHHEHHEHVAETHHTDMHHEHEHGPHEYKESHPNSHRIEHKPHACSADCPEHSHGSHNHRHEREAKEQKIELKGHLACGPDCPEHSHAAHTHHDHHEPQTEKPHTIAQKAPEHTCGADCPEHGHAHHHNHAHETQSTSEKVHADTHQRQAEALQAQHKIEQELGVTQPLPPEQDKPAPAAEQTAQSETQIHEDVAVRQEQQRLDSIVAETMEHARQSRAPGENAQRRPITTEVAPTTDDTPKAIQEVEVEAVPVNTQPTPEGFAETETSDSTSVVVPTEAMEQPAATSLEQRAAVDVATDHEQFEAASEIALPAPMPAIESQPDAPQETIFDIPALLAEQTEITAGPPETVSSPQNEREPLAAVPLPELPAAAEPLPIAAATIAQAITERYQNVAEITPGIEDKTTPLQPAQLVELRSIITAIQSRNISAQVGTQEAQLMVMPQEFVRLLQLLGFENPAQTLESYVRQYGYAFYEDLLAQLFELLQYAKPIEAPTLSAPTIADDQTDWVHTLGKAAMLLGMLAKQLMPSPAVLHRSLRQPEGAVS